MTLEETLQTAIQSAKAGQHRQARALFIQVLKQDQRNLLAWVWLSEVAEDLPHRIAALERALILQPGDPLLQGRLEALRRQVPANSPAEEPPVTEQAAAQPEEGARASETRAQMAQEKIVQAHNPVTGELVPEAARLLEEAVALDEHNVPAWLLLSEAYPKPEERINALERGARANPGSEEITRRITVLRDAANDALLRGKHQEERGDYEAAISTYTSIITHSRSALERVEATRRIEDIRMRQEADQIQPVKPTLNLVRLALGPVLLFMVIIFVHSGLNLLHTPLAALPGLLAVTTGSLMVTVTGMRPAHPRWVEHFGMPGTGDEPETRHGVRLVGFALVIAPFLIFFFDAASRLLALQASLPVK